MNEIDLYSTLYLLSAVVVALHYAVTVRDSRAVPMQEYLTIMLSIFLPIVNTGIGVLIIIHNWSDLVAGVKRFLRKE